MDEQGASQDDHLGGEAIPELRKRFQELVDRNYDPLWSYGHFLTGGTPDSEDILHQAFLLAHDYLANGGTFRVGPGKWLRGVVRNLVRTWWSEKRKMPRDLAGRLAFLAGQDERGATAVVPEELMAALEHCLGKLGADDRTLVSKRYEQGLRIVAIAERMQCNVTTLRVRLFRVRQSLKACVETVLSRGGVP